MKNIRIVDEPKKVIFDVTGSFEDINDLKQYLNTLLHLFVITGEIGRLSGSENRIMEITCPETTYEQVITLLKDFISG